MNPNPLGAPRADQATKVVTINGGERFAPEVPHDLAAEHSVLGGILLRNEGLALVKAIIGADEFYRHGHRKIFSAMLELDARGDAIDLVTVKAQLGASDLDDVGGVSYLARLVDGVPRATNVEYYAGIVRDRAHARRLLKTFDAGRRHALDGNMDEAYAALASGFGELTGASAHDRKFEHGAEQERMRRKIKRAVDAEERGPVPERRRVRHRDLMAQPDTLDPLVDGLIDRKDGVVLAGPSGVGKTFLALDLAHCIATGRPWLGMRISKPGGVAWLAYEGEVDLQPRSRALALADGHRLDDDLNLEFFADYGPLLDRAAVEEFIADLRTITDLRLVVIDTLGHAIGAESINEEQPVRTLNANLKRVRTELGCATLLVHHYGRNGDREMGSVYIRNDADLALGLRSVDRRVEVAPLKSRRTPPGWKRRFRLVPTTPHQKDTGIIAVYDDSPFEVEPVAAPAVAPKVQRARDLRAQHPEWSKTRLVQALGGRWADTAAIVDAVLAEELPEALPRA